MWPLDYVVLNSDNLALGTISSILATLLFILASAFYPPLRKISQDIRKLFVLFIRNPSLSVQVEIGGFLDPISQIDYRNRIIRDLESISGVLPKEGQGGTIQFKKIFTNFEIDTDIIPETPPSIGDYGEVIDEVNEDKYVGVSIIFRTRNLKLRNFKEGIRMIQSFLFQEMNLAINQNLRMNLDPKKESVVIAFDEFPTMLKFIKDLNVESLTAKEKDVDIIFSKDKIRIKGIMHDTAIEKIERLIKSNLGA